MYKECSVAPGKVLLFGEHFAVKGKPALGLAISLRAKACVYPGSMRVYSRQLGPVTSGSQHWGLFDALFKYVESAYGRVPRVDVEIDSEIPMAAGMGSSASIAVALAHALLSYMNVEFTHEDVWRVAYEAEKAVHYMPSGVDTKLATYGGILYYKQGVVKRVDLKLPETVEVVVVNTRVTRSTGRVVKEVLERYERLGEIGDLIYKAAEALVDKAIRSLEAGDLHALGELMLVNHGLLWAMGASAEVCDRVVYELVKLGAYGAKLSGAGRGGIVIGLVDGEKSPGVLKALRDKGFDCFTVKPSYVGVCKLSS